MVELFNESNDDAPKSPITPHVEPHFHLFFTTGERELERQLQVVHRWLDFMDDKRVGVHCRRMLCGSCCEELIKRHTQGGYR